jgi:hypothetical protein
VPSATKSKWRSSGKHKRRRYPASFPLVRLGARSTHIRRRGSSGSLDKLDDQPPFADVDFHLAADRETRSFKPAAARVGKRVPRVESPATGTPNPPAVTRDPPSMRVAPRLVLHAPTPMMLMPTVTDRLPALTARLRDCDDPSREALDGSTERWAAPVSDFTPSTADTQRTSFLRRRPCV